MTQLYLYKISQSVNRNYDTFDSAIVAAETPEAAQKIAPSKQYWEPPDESEEYLEWIKQYWASPENVQVELIGTAATNIQAGTVLASFNAG